MLGKAVFGKLNSKTRCLLPALQRCFLFLVMAQKPIPTTSFYASKSTEIRITNRGVVETKRFTAVEIPDGFDSEDEEDDDGDLHDPDDGDYNPLRDEYEEEIVDSNDY